MRRAPISSRRKLSIIKENIKDKTTGTVRAKHSRFCGFLFVDRADWKMVFLEKFVAEVQIYRKLLL